MTDAAFEKLFCSTRHLQLRKPLLQCCFLVVQRLSSNKQSLASEDVIKLCRGLEFSLLSDTEELWV